MFVNCDFDESNGIDLEEFKLEPCLQAKENEEINPPGRIFQIIDTNDDNIVTNDEFVSAHSNFDLLTLFGFWTHKTINKVYQVYAIIS